MFNAIMIGAGSRGIGVYGEYAIHHPDEIRFTGVAEPDPERRLYFAFQHQIPDTGQFTDFREILAKPKFADVCFICTQDNMHVEPALLAMEKGYHVFLEKPMAVTPSDCLLLGEAAKKYNRRIMTGHVLRYTAFFAQIKAWLDEGKIGRLMSIQHNENVSFWHQAHSYVRGNWRNTLLSSPMILAKSCHDLDLMFWFAGSEPVKVSSFGKLSHFKESEAPANSPDFCMDGCPHQETCLYYAPKVYLNAPIWMKLPVANDMSDESLLKALRKGPYGRCVYHSDNDVVDHQVTTIEFANEVTVAFTMTGFTNENTRTIKLMGTSGEIRGHLDKNELELIPFSSGKPETVLLDQSAAGHGGGDTGIMEAFVKLIEADTDTEKTSFAASITSHLLAFAAELSRKTNQVVDFGRYRDSLRMLEFRTLFPEAYDSAIRLASTTFNENMLDEFTLLLGKTNQKRMFVAVSGTAVKAMVNYYPATIRIGQARIKVGSIGSVCTDPLYRQQNIASKLLKMAEMAMLKEKIRFEIISGEGSLYSRFGATRVGNVTGYQIGKDAQVPNNKIKIKTYAGKDFPELKRLYESEPNRYLRKDQEFKALIRGQTYPGTTATCHLEMLEDDNRIVAYVFLKRPYEKDEILIREFGGDRTAIFASLPGLLAKHQKSVLLLPVDAFDPINALLGDYPHQSTDQHASFKVIDWNGFFSDLQALDGFAGIGVDFLNGKPLLTIGNKLLELADIHELHRLVFGPADKVLAKVDDPDLKAQLTSIFPLPFVWTNNLNYQ